MIMGFSRYILPNMLAWLLNLVAIKATIEAYLAAMVVMGKQRNVADYSGDVVPEST